MIQKGVREENARLKNCCDNFEPKIFLKKINPKISYISSFFCENYRSLCYLKRNENCLPKFSIIFLASNNFEEITQKKKINSMYGIFLHIYSFESIETIIIKIIFCETEKFNSISHHRRGRVCMSV